MNIVDTIKGNYGYKIRISYAEDSQNSREEFDNFATLIFFHKKYNVTNETDLKAEDYKNWDGIEKAIKKIYGTSIILPVYMYDHSGVAIKTSNFNDPWDSGQIGFIFVPHKKIREEFSLKRVSKKSIAKSHEILQNELETYGAYLNGDVYEFDILDALDGVQYSSSGFYGNDHKKSGLIEAAESAIEDLTSEKPVKPDAIQLELELSY